MNRILSALALFSVVACGSADVAGPPEEAAPTAVEEALDEGLRFDLHAATPTSTVLVADGIWLEESPTTFELVVDDGAVTLGRGEDGGLLVEQLSLALTGLDHEMWDGQAHMDDLAITLEEPVALDGTLGEADARAEGTLPLRIDWWIETASQTHDLASQAVELTVELTLSGPPSDPALELRLHREGDVFAIDGVFDVSVVDLRTEG